MQCHGCVGCDWVLLVGHLVAVVVGAVAGGGGGNGCPALHRSAATPAACSSHALSAWARLCCRAQRPSCTPTFHNRTRPHCNTHRPCCMVRFHRGLGASLEVKRALLAPHLEALGFNILPGHGAYFLVADVSKFLREGEDDAAFCMRLTREGGVTLIPVSDGGCLVVCVCVQEEEGQSAALCRGAVVVSTCSTERGSWGVMGTHIHSVALPQTVLVCLPLLLVVAPIPPSHTPLTHPTMQISGFYVGPNPPRHLVRFAYCKDDAKLMAAVERLEKYLGPDGAGAPSKA